MFQRKLDRQIKEIFNLWVLLLIVVFPYLFEGVKLLNKTAPAIFKIIEEHDIIKIEYVINRPGKNYQGVSDSEIKSEVIKLLVTLESRQIVKIFL